VSQYFICIARSGGRFVNNRHISLFLDSWRGRLIGRLRLRGLSIEEAEDNIQKASLLALGIITLRTADEKQLLAWFTLVAYRHWLNERIHATTLECIPFQNGEVNLLSCPADSIEQVESRLCIQHAWNDLNKQDKEVLILKSCGMNCQQIAVVLDIHMEAAKKRLQSARKHFQERLQDSGIDIASSGKRILPRSRV
jgi:DNA-directed RNA polymerase specialized sigma24 family protein